MLAIYRWLFRVAGLLPHNTRLDKYFTSVTVLIQLCSLYYSANDAFSMNDSLFLAIFYITENVVFCIIPVLYEIKIYVYREDFIDLIKRCFLSRGLDERRSESTQQFEISSILLFSFIFMARLLMRYKISQMFLRSLLYDFAMATIYLSLVMEILMIHHLSSRFAVLNDQLRQVSVAIRAQSSYVNNLRAELAAVFTSHTMLRQLRTKINSHFGHFNAIIVSCSTLYGTYTMYVLLLNLAKQEDVSFLDILVFTSGLSSTMFLCDACYRCCEQVL